jgi:hypothetical protein
LRVIIAFWKFHGVNAQTPIGCFSTEDPLVGLVWQDHLP